MNVQMVEISSIKIVNRRREDFGDVEGLAESIRKYGLLHPVTVDGDFNLVAGDRRVRAFQLLGRMEIPARLYSELTDDERNEIELEENIRRKDLTPYEASKNLVKLAEVAAKVDKQELPKITFDNPERKAGRPSVAGSKARTAERIGVSAPAITNAQNHVSAVERYPELAIIAPTQKDAITVARNLDALPETARSDARSRLMKHDQSALATLAEKPPMPKPKPRPSGNASDRWRDYLQSIRQLFSGIEQTGGASALADRWTQEQGLNFLDDLRGFRADLDTHINELEEKYEELKQQVG